MADDFESGVVEDEEEIDDSGDMGEPSDGFEEEVDPQGAGDIVLYVGVVIHENNARRIIVVGTPQIPVPMVTADERVLPQMIERIQIVSNALQKPVEILKLSGSEVVRHCDPQKIVTPKISMSSSMLTPEDLKPR